MTLFNFKYRIESARLQGYDYSSPGYYFITVVTKNRVPFLGQITNGEMIKSEIGETVELIWHKIPEIFPNSMLDEFIVMPDHVHGIVVITDASPRAHNHTHIRIRIRIRRDAINRVSTGGSIDTVNSINAGGVTGSHNPMLVSASLGAIIRWFKGRCSHEIRRLWPMFGWQPRFQDRIIRTNRELLRIRRYIIDNPAKGVIKR